ncbi:hypothetical protein LSAT2_027797 [Lamellibrachia satsuma]|nr:hypothetical protein LSAT2_027797 [Lamellibrachia satsuma]
MLIFFSHLSTSLSCSLSSSRHSRLPGPASCATPVSPFGALLSEKALRTISLRSSNAFLIVPSCTYTFQTAQHPFMLTVRQTYKLNCEMKILFHPLAVMNSAPDPPYQQRILSCLLTVVQHAVMNSSPDPPYQQRILSCC